MSRLLALSFILFFALLPRLAFAVEASEMLKDPKLEARAEALSSELRCLVCQNESIEDSQAQLAHDLRVLIRQRILAGESNAQIKKFLVSRYGDFILLKPPFQADTLLLWGTPLVALFCGGVAIIWSLRRRGPLPKTASLSAAETEKLAAFLGKEEA